MFNIYYIKNKKDLTLENVSKLQNYIPIYKQFFSLNEKNYNSINLNHKYHIADFLERKSDNIYLCQIQNISQKIKVNSFLKFSPLIDPVKYMAGKYKHNNHLTLPHLNDDTSHYKIRDKNNSAYVDSFFSFLSSQILHNHRFYHGIDFYGSFLGIKRNFMYNIVDDVEYLRQSNYFHTNNKKKFHIESMYEDMIFNFDSRKYKKRLKITNCVKDISDTFIEPLILDYIFASKTIMAASNSNICTLTDISNGFLHSSDISSNILKIDTNHSSTTSTKNSTCSSRSSHTSVDSNASDQTQELLDSDEESSSSNYSLSTTGDDILQATLYNFPVQVICLESLTNTLDSIMGVLDIDEWRSCLFQVIMSLVVYQKLFDFTHNDLHTNNIMYKETDKTFLYYYYNKRYYKVPTFGKIYKIIDFGRAIYKFKNKVICSDSYHPKGDAASQYNCEPYFNKKKPRLDPNKSFDICRLGCSLYDFFFQEYDDDDDDELPNPLPKLVEQWCRDDKGRNILYKKNGEERYPEFKLYKMIARTVHHCPPDKEINNPYFQKFIVSRKKIQKKARILSYTCLRIYVIWGLELFFGIFPLKITSFPLHLPSKGPILHWVDLKCKFPSLWSPNISEGSSHGNPFTSIKSSHSSRHPDFLMFEISIFFFCNSPFISVIFKIFFVPNITPLLSICKIQSHTSNEVSAEYLPQ